MYVTYLMWILSIRLRCQDFQKNKKKKKTKKTQNQRLMHHTSDPRPDCLDIASFTTLVHNDPHAFRIGPEARVEEVVRDLHVRIVRLVQLESEAARGENGGEGEVELAVCEAIYM